MASLRRESTRSSWRSSACYLDHRLAKPGSGFDRVAAFIETLAVELGQELLGRQFATAAE